MVEFALNAFETVIFTWKIKNVPGKKFEDVKQQKLLDENPIQTLLELSKALNITPMSQTLNIMGKILEMNKRQELSLLLNIFWL